MRFDEWFNEIEGYALRSERFYDELGNINRNNGDYIPGDFTYQHIVAWLRAAYEEGYKQARYDTMKIYWDDGK